ncbi:MAG: TIGR04255 family protein, partial [Pseudomonadota bacterium]
MNSTLPKKITPCPLLEAVSEIRFSSKIEGAAVFGMLYEKLKSDYPGDVKKLPILQLPEQVRASEPSLKFKP